jgi:hypothetical protein
VIWGKKYENVKNKKRGKCKRKRKQGGRKRKKGERK